MKVATIDSNDLSFMQKGLQEFFLNNQRMEELDLQAITKEMVETPHTKVSPLGEDEILVGIRQNLSPHYTFILHNDEVYMWAHCELGTGVSLRNGFQYIGVYKKVTNYVHAIMEKNEKLLPEWIMDMVQKVNWLLQYDLSK